jgi:hypothetical protein
VVAWLVAVASTASAGEVPFGVESAGGDITIVARGVKPAEGAVIKVRDLRVEIELAAASDSMITSLSVNDPLLKTIDFLKASPPRLSVLFHSGTNVTAIAAAASFTVKNGEIRLTMPREPTAVKPDPAIAAVGEKMMRTPFTDLRTGVADAPTPPVVAAPAAAAPVAKAASPVPAPALPPPPSVVVPAAEASAIPAAAAPVAAAPVAAAPVGSAAAPPSLRMPILVLLGLGACAGLVVLARRRRVGGEDARAIRVISSQSVGRTRIVLIGTGRRELLLAVGDKETKVIGRWRARPGMSGASDAVSGLSGASGAVSGVSGSASGASGSASGVSGGAGRLSPAVAGLMRLRNSTSDTPAPGEDAAWTRELLAAARRGNPQ